MSIIPVIRKWPRSIYVSHDFPVSSLNRLYAVKFDLNHVEGNCFSGEMNVRRVAIRVRKIFRRRSLTWRTLSMCLVISTAKRGPQKVAITTAMPRITSRNGVSLTRDQDFDLGRSSFGSRFWRVRGLLSKCGPRSAAHGGNAAASGFATIAHSYTQSADDVPLECTEAALLCLREQLARITAATRNIRLCMTFLG